MSTLHKNKRLSLGGGVFKMPFSLSRPATGLHEVADDSGGTMEVVSAEDVIACSLHRVFKTHACSKVKLCSSTYGWATFVPHTSQDAQPQPVAPKTVDEAEHLMTELCKDAQAMAQGPFDPHFTLAREEAMYV